MKKSTDQRDEEEEEEGGGEKEADEKRGRKEGRKKERGNRLSEQETAPSWRIDGQEVVAENEEEILQFSFFASVPLAVLHIPLVYRSAICTTVVTNNTDTVQLKRRLALAVQVSCWKASCLREGIGHRT